MKEIIKLDFNFPLLIFPILAETISKIEVGQLFVSFDSFND